MILTIIVIVTFVLFVQYMVLGPKQTKEQVFYFAPAKVDAGLKEKYDEQFIGLSQKINSDTDIISLEHRQKQVDRFKSIYLDSEVVSNKKLNEDVDILHSLILKQYKKIDKKWKNF